MTELQTAIRQMSIVRLICIFATFFANIDVFLKILILLSIDSFKFVYLYLTVKELKKGDLAMNAMYQRWDKILDMLSYVLVQTLLMKHSILTNLQTNIMLGLLAERMIGEMLYAATDKREYLFYFPDVYKEILLVFYVFGENWSAAVPVGATSIAAKFYLEYKFHVSLEGGTDFVHWFILAAFVLWCYRVFGLKRGGVIV